MKSKIRTAAVLLLPVAALLCMYPVRLRLAPRWTLSQALGTALTQLETRFKCSPIHLLLSALDPDGKQNIRLQAETQPDNLGPVLFDMTLDMQLSPKILSGTGSVVYHGKQAELSIYTDRNFAAIASENLTGGNYYGIRFDTFPQDIRSREILAALIGSMTISSWEASVAELGETMGEDLFIPRISAEDIRAILYSVMALKPKIGIEEIPTSDGVRKVQVVSFRETGAAVAALAKPHKDQLPNALFRLVEVMESDPDSSLCIRFFLHQGKLLQISADLNRTGDTLGLLVYLGEAPETNDLRLELDIRQGDDREAFSAALSTESDEEVYRETIHLTCPENPQEGSSTLEYLWDLSSGDMQLEISHKGKTASQRLNLAGEGSSFTIMSQNIRPILNLLTDKNKTNPVICTATVSPGAYIRTPEYRNLDQWTPEDLFALITGLGDWIGLKIS